MLFDCDRVHLFFCLRRRQHETILLIYSRPHTVKILGEKKRFLPNLFCTQVCGQ